MWFKVDGEALDDWRYPAMGMELGVSMYEAFWLACRVWRRLYKQGGGYMSARDVDAAAGRAGVAKAMLASELADETPDGLRIHGDERAAEYGRFIECQKVKSEAGVAAKVMAKTNSNPRVDPGVNPGVNPVLYLSESGSSPDPESGKSQARARQAEARQAAQAACDAWVEWFNRRFTRSFRVTQALVKQVGAILAQGYSEKPDMRAVALYLGSRWQDDEKMAVHLVPSTILRATKFAERVDLAKEWRPDLWGSP